MTTSKMSKRKPTKKICGYTVPNPPRSATHIALETPCGRRACVAIKDFDTLRDCEGTFSYIRKDRKGKTLEKFPEVYNWTGSEVLF